MQKRSFHCQTAFHLLFIVFALGGMTACTRDMSPHDLSTPQHADTLREPHAFLQGNITITLSRFVSLTNCPA